MPNTFFSISDKALAGTDPFDGLRLLRDHGFTHLHFSYKWQSKEDVADEEIERLQRGLNVANIKVLDVHGPHPGGLNFAGDNPEDRQFAFNRVRRRLQITHLLGGDAMVYHVPEREFSDAILERYIDGLQRLEDEARELGVKIALENHYKLDHDRYTLAACFEKFDPQYLGFTFDPGHANISGNTDWLLKNCMDRLTILHLNDNDSAGDRHWNPFQKEGTVQWEPIMEAIANSPYRKPIQLEVYWRDDKHETREDFLNVAAQAAHKLHAGIYEREQVEA